MCLADIPLNNLRATRRASAASMPYTLSMEKFPVVLWLVIGLPVKSIMASIAILGKTPLIQNFVDLTENLTRL
jgi:hypothetical protein